MATKQHGTTKRAKKAPAKKSKPGGTKLDDLVKDGFSLSDAGSRIKNASLFSLRIGLKAYLSTYQPMKYGLHMFEPTSTTDLATADFNTSSYFAEHCVEAIVHLQHFFELALKEILKGKHALLALDAASKPALHLKLLRGEKVQEADIEGARSIEFSEALTRVVDLVKSGHLSKRKWGFVVEGRAVLSHLGTIRNRMWHRGTFILRYKALDEFMIGHVLPLAMKMLDTTLFRGNERIWKYEALACGIDPLKILVRDGKAGRYDIQKVALLKELGRAAYEDDMRIDAGQSFDEQAERERLENSAEYLAGNETHVDDVVDCPVCGLNTLVVYDDVEHDEDSGSHYRYTWAVECLCCTFSINHHLANPSKLGLKLPSYWKTYP